MIGKGQSGEDLLSSQASAKAPQPGPRGSTTAKGSGRRHPHYCWGPALADFHPVICKAFKLLHQRSAGAATLLSAPL